MYRTTLFPNRVSLVLLFHYVCWSDDKDPFNLAVVFEGIGGQDKILVGYLHGVFKEEEVFFGVVPPNLTDKHIGCINDFSPCMVIPNVSPQVKSQLIGRQDNGFVDQFDISIHLCNSAVTLVFDLVSIEIQRISLDNVHVAKSIHFVAVTVIIGAVAIKDCIVVTQFNISN